jgi:hypothetical protein
MSKAKFNTQLADSQATAVNPVPASKFDFERYVEYESQKLKQCSNFWESSSGVLVYRRMRVGEVFSYGCGDMKKSLEWQLGALEKSKPFKADVPNFLEPWYGIGTTASAFGIDYLWFKGQAPAVLPKFKTVEEALDYHVKPVHETPIGKHTLNMIEYFMEQTKGLLPVSFCDIQSPFNVAPNVVDTSNFMTDMYMNPDGIMEFLDLLAGLIKDFTQKQEKLIGDRLVKPGHGFASSRVFDGFGMSEDNIVMVSGELYKDLIVPSFDRLGKEFGGAVFHSCGNYAGKLDAVKSIGSLKMLDAAFSEETDPDPNPPESFRESFSNTGIVVNARVVGGLNEIEEKVKALWKPGMKLIVVTYCQTPEEQKKAYDLIHEICV